MPNPILTINHLTERTQKPWPGQVAPVRLIQLTSMTLKYLAGGDLAAANRALPILLGSYFIGDECRYVWKMRSAQVDRDPRDLTWIARIIYDPRTGTSVGRAGFHRQPDADGRVEVGYSVDPNFRRHGYARAALLGLISRAQTEPSVRVLCAAIRLDNLASRNLALQCGLTPVGARWTVTDGLEVVYEIGVHQH